MTTWESYMRGQEDAAFGKFLMETIASIYGVEADEKKIDRAVYKSTECGAWFKMEPEGPEVGTIVEGSDAEFSTWVDVSGLDYDEESEKILKDRFLSAIAECESFAAKAWGEVNG